MNNSNALLGESITGSVQFDAERLAVRKEVSAASQSALMSLKNGRYDQFNDLIQDALKNGKYSGLAQLVQEMNELAKEHAGGSYVGYRMPSAEVIAEHAIYDMPWTLADFKPHKISL